MGREICVFEDDILELNTQKTEDAPLLVASLVRQVRTLSPSDLKSFFDSLFSKMTTSSKEAITEIM